MSVEDMVAIFIEWFNKHVADSDVPKLTRSNVYVVWFCYILANAKILISTEYPDHMYYELTYDYEKERVYVDAYKKFRHDCCFTNKEKLDQDFNDFYYTSIYKKENKNA